MNFLPLSSKRGNKINPKFIIFVSKIDKSYEKLDEKFFD